MSVIVCQYTVLSTVYSLILRNLILPIHLDVAVYCSHFVLRQWGPGPSAGPAAGGRPRRNDAAAVVLGAV